MVEFTRMQVVGLATHYVGNFGLGEELKLSEHPIKFKEDYVEATFYDYVLSGFKTDIYYKFKKHSDSFLYDVRGTVENLFKDQKDFFESSIVIAKHLYQQTVNPKVKGGELYVTYIKDVVVDGELCDAVGIFKSESRDTFIKVDSSTNDFTIETDLGINPKKLDKGVLIFNLDKNNGYKAMIIDTSQKIADVSTYWSLDFLFMELKESPYLSTINSIGQCVGFCEEILTEENNVKKNDKNMILNSSVKFFDEHDTFNQDEFEKEILSDQKLIQSFRDHQADYNKTYGIKATDNFTISKTAVKKNSKLMKSVISLDKNFDIHIKGRHDYVENGYDEEKGLKFYKLYYVNEE